jgi:hypothetical protein
MNEYEDDYDLAAINSFNEYMMEMQEETKGADAAIAAINFALEAEEGLMFLRCWNEGDFKAIRGEWPEAPETVFIGVDPLYKYEEK